MTNIALSIEESVYKRMRKHSEIKWSEFIRKMISKKVEELNKSKNKESILTILASERVLNKDWNNKEDERWDSV